MRAVPLLLLLLWPGGCAVEFLSTTPTNPGAPTAPAEVVALAGPDLVVLEGSRVVLAGGASRALVGSPELAWSQREGPLATLSNPSAAAPAFVAPLGPARLVFSLEVTADDVRDVDEVVVDVVTDAVALPTAPRVLAMPADRSVELDAAVRLETPWTGAGVPVVSARCATAGGPVARIEGATLVVELTPRGLPCPVVVEDVVDAGAAGTVPAAGRGALTLWPADVVVASATRARAPATVEAGATVVIDLDPGAAIAVVDGATLTLERSGDRVAFVAPRRPGRLTLVAESRVGGSSGGPRVIAIEVGPGAGNVAPTLDGGLDLRVRPGASFRIAPRAADDNVDDVITVDVRQVLGEPARQAGGGVGVLVAPDVNQAQTLLFHVVAGDGRAESAIDPVRVFVDPAAENQPPVLVLPPELYVTPGSTFVIDGSGASDPDAGLIASWRIAQAQTDDVILLADASDAPAVTLSAGAAGERYQFVVSVADDGGLEASASVVVIVEEAGPFVDPARALDAGNGTVGRPFSSISAALLTAARHRLPALHLAVADGALPVGALPDGLGLEGGWRYDDDSGAYVQDAAASSIRLAGGELRLAGGTFSRLSIGADDDVVLRLQRGVTLRDLTVATDASVVTIAVDAGARAVITASTLGPVDNAGTLELDDTTVLGPLTARDAVTAIGPASSIVDAATGDGADDNRAVVDVIGGVLRIDSSARLVGRRTGLRVGPGAVAAVAGDIDIDGGDDAGGREIGLQVVGGTVELAGGTVRVAGGDAVGILHTSGTVGGRARLLIDGDSVIGVDASAAFGADLGGDWEVVGVTLGIGARGPDVALEQARLAVEANDASGVLADTVTLAACLVETRGTANDVGVVARRGALRHVTLRGSDRCLEGIESVRIDNSLCLSPGAFVGVIAFGVVGVVDSIDPGALACTTCIPGPAGAVDVTGALVDDSALGGPNPFVDVGDPTTAVAADLVGAAIPAGSGPDLGALERAAP